MSDETHIDGIALTSDLDNTQTNLPVLECAVVAGGDLLSQEYGHRILYRSDNSYPENGTNDKGNSNNGLMHVDLCNTMNSIESLQEDTRTNKNVMHGTVEDALAGTRQQGEPLREQIFSEVFATISDHVMQILSTASPMFYEVLHRETNVSYLDKASAAAGGSIIKGTLQQIVSAQRCLRKYLADIQQNQQVKADEDESYRTWVHTSNKAVMCDLIKPSQLSQFAMDHPREARLSSWLFRQPSLAARSAVKVKYRTHRRVVNKRRKVIIRSSAHGITQGNASFDGAGMLRKNATVCGSRLVVNDYVICTDETPVEQHEEFVSTRPENRSINVGHQSQLTQTREPQDENVAPKVCINKSRPNYEEMKPFKFFCKQCSYKSKRESHYVRHLALHEKVKTLYSCDKCTFTTIRLSHLRRHEISHSQTTFDCDLCPYKTDVLKLLHRHVKLKHNQKEDVSLAPAQVFECTQCTYKTNLSHNFRRHLKVHGPHDSPRSKRVYLCDQCDYKTNRKEHYRRHVSNVHGDNRPYLCDFCGKAFKRPDALKQHHMTHISANSRIVQFRCGVCQKDCRSQHQLNEHQAVHTDVRAFLCEICGASFKTRSVHRKHVLNIHKNPRSHSCEHCLKRFNTNFALRRHLRLHEADDDDDDDGGPILPPLDGTSTGLLATSPLPPPSAASDDVPFVHHHGALSTVGSGTTLAYRPEDAAVTRAAAGTANATSLLTVMPVVQTDTKEEEEVVIDVSDGASLVPAQGHFSQQSDDNLHPEQTMALLYLTTTFTQL